MTTTDFAELHDDLRAVAADVLSRGRVVDWPTMADAGWVGLEVPEAFGGAGATFAEVAVVCQELGRAAAATPYLGSAVLTVGVLTTLQDSVVRDALVADVATGAAQVAVAIGDFTLDADRRLTGRADFVPDAEGADRLLVLATDASGADVAVAAEGLTVTPQPVLDETRRVATVTADGIEVAEPLRFAGGARPVLNRAAVAVACDSLGLAEAMLAATVSYAQTREQFGRPIGSFQAVKHACADMQVKVSVARALVREAVEAVVAVAGPDGAEIEADAAVAMAKSYTCGAAVDVVGKAMQLHGGIGYTWESGIHVYLKRAVFNRSLFGSPAAHRQRLAQRY
ncbi:acyl-CoA dehydrogenase [Mycolicibacter terrae]|uniref:Acyl-CoA dehydrogenase n=1 Tax=Mycolicibacter terrae TaxID=1788 RepID=A0AAD1I171_9MYCO|nr:acyl-CoA dehydrogenase family protein [Mycolicibacter terrae]ORW98266.1 acyl-CoA dehydrogenase [Mycolicibacter terrae]BBX23915.1 acyl-CoA dehydrogenase [Mycolicibacter terrae]SNV58458.1 acyl-CoA dehydrogenase [Mycolicibacter terrae]